MVDRGSESRPGKARDSAKPCAIGSEIRVGHHNSEGIDYFGPRPRGGDRQIGAKEGRRRRSLGTSLPRALKRLVTWHYSTLLLPILQSEHNVRRFSRTVSPPLLQATMWSMWSTVLGTMAGLLPQPQHVNLSRSKTLKRRRIEGSREVRRLRSSVVAWRAIGASAAFAHSTNASNAPVHVRNLRLYGDCEISDGAKANSARRGWRPKCCQRTRMLAKRLSSGYSP